CASAACASWERSPPGGGGCPRSGDRKAHERARSICRLWRERVPGAERVPPGTSRRIYRSRRDMRHWRTREIILARDAVVGAGKETPMSRYPILVAAAAAVLAMSPALGQQDTAADYHNRPVKIIFSVRADCGVVVIS